METDQAVICLHCDVLADRNEKRGWGVGSVDSLFCHIEQPSLSKKGCRLGRRTSEFVSMEFLKRVIMWVKRKRKHKAGFMCACSGRVLMLGSYTMLAGNC